MLKVSLRGEDSFGAPGSTKQDSLNELAADKVDSSCCWQMVQSAANISRGKNLHTVSLCTTVKNNPTSVADRGGAKHVGQRPEVPEMRWEERQGNRLQPGRKNRSIWHLPVPQVHP